MTGQKSNERWIPLCRLDEIEIGRGYYIERQGGSLCVVRSSESEAVVIDDTCPHAGMSIAGGRVYDACMVCPWHAWEFRLEDGRNPDNPEIGVRRYRSQVRRGVVEVPVSELT